MSYICYTVSLICYIVPVIPQFLKISVSQSENIFCLLQRAHLFAVCSLDVSMSAWRVFIPFRLFSNMFPTPLQSLKNPFANFLLIRLFCRNRVNDVDVIL